MADIEYKVTWYNANFIKQNYCFRRMLQAQDLKRNLMIGLHDNVRREDYEIQIIEYDWDDPPRTEGG